MVKIICTDCNEEMDMMSCIRNEPKNLIIKYICPNCGAGDVKKTFLYEKADIGTKCKELLKFITTNLKYLEDKRKDVQIAYDDSDNILDNVKQTIHLERVKSEINILNQIKNILENK